MLRSSYYGIEVMLIPVVGVASLFRLETNENPG